MLPLGATRKERTGDYVYTLEVVGYNDKSKKNVWAEKSKKYSPAPRINVGRFTEAWNNNEDWERAKRLGREINNISK